CQRPVPGRLAARWIVSLTSLSRMLTPWGASRWTSACVPAGTVWQAWHSPPPTSSGWPHCRAGAERRAATLRPLPRGPVRSARPAPPPPGRPGARPRVPHAGVGLLPAPAGDAVTCGPCRRGQLRHGLILAGQPLEHPWHTPTLSAAPDTTAVPGVTGAN